MYYDVIIIGGGNAGFGVSSIIKDTNKSIAFIEQDKFGGTCPNRGCTPKKVMVAAASVLSEISVAKEHKIDVGEVNLDWAGLINRAQDMISFIPNAMKDTAKSRGDTYLGKATFTGENEVTVVSDDNTTQTLTAANIVIATGSITRPLNIKGAEYLKTSDYVLSSTKKPESVIFIGGGVIALEFSHVYARAGVNVTILEAMPSLLPRMDTDAVQQLRTLTESLGVDIKTSVKVNEISKDSDGTYVHFEHEGNTESLQAEIIINGAGRIANTAALNLSAANIEMDGPHILLNEHLQSTSNKAVWVAGDALTTSAQLSPVATHEGKIVGHNILNDNKKTLNYDTLPSAVHTVPALSSVGLTEQQAIDQGLNISVKVNDMSSWFSAKSYAELAAWCKVIVNTDTDTIIGAHMLGHSGQELIHVFSLAMQFNITASQLAEFIFAYPTFSSDIKNLV